MTEQSPTPSMSTPAVQATPTPNSSTVKPIKLRAACNHCFSAKVRCDGNKQGCRRCCEKRLACTYSESRVGKVVGKRRKRTLDDSIGMVNSEAWVLNQNLPMQSIPSPAATNSSDENSKRQRSTISRTSFIGGDDRGFLTFDEGVEALKLVDMPECGIVSNPGEMAFLGPSGLPTPALSPPQLRYLSPSVLETRPISRQTSVVLDSATLLSPRYLASSMRAPEPPQVEDEETVCIKLLAHLKKHSGQRLQSRETQVNLLRRSNAAVRRILRGKNTKSNYTCQLLLSSIITYLVCLCEEVSIKRLEERESAESPFLQEQIHFDATVGYFDVISTHPPQTGSGDSIAPIIREAITLTTAIGDLLKRKPLDGFQILGRHESLHLELEQRLQRALAGLYYEQYGT